MSKRIIIAFVIMLILIIFTSKRRAESITVSYLVEVSNQEQIEVTIHKKWSRLVGSGKYEVFVEYSANTLWLVSMFEVEEGQVVSGVRVSE